MAKSANGDGPVLLLAAGSKPAVNSQHLSPDHCAPQQMIQLKGREWDGPAVLLPRTTRRVD
jgi:hypothetical protein